MECYTGTAYSKYCNVFKILHTFSKNEKHGKNGLVVYSQYCICGDEVNKVREVFAVCARPRFMTSVHLLPLHFSHKNIKD